MLKKGIRKEELHIDSRTASFPSQVQCCLFCFKNCEEVNEVNYISTLSTNVSKFLLSFYRYLGERYINGQRVCHSTTIFSNGIGSESENWMKRLEACEDCSFLLGDFCTSYDQFKCLELKLNWRMKNLLEIMKCAEKVPSRLKAFRTQIISLNEREESEARKKTLIKIKKFRNGLMEKCSAKLQSTYPKIQLKRCNSSEADCTGDDTNKRIKVEIVQPEQGSTISSENDSNSQATPKLESITDKPLHIEDEGSSIIDVSSFFPVSVKVPQSEDAEESCESNCDGNIGTDEASDKLGCNEGDALRFSSPSESERQTDDDLAAPCISSTIHSERNQNQEDGERNKCDQNQIVTTNIASKITGQLKETCQTVPDNINERRYSKRLRKQVKAIESQFPNNDTMLKTSEQTAVDKTDEMYSPLRSPEGQDSDNDDDADYTPEVDADRLDDDDNDISIKESNNTILINKVEEERTKVKVHGGKDPTTPHKRRQNKRLLKIRQSVKKRRTINRNEDANHGISKEQRELLSLKQLALNSVMDLPKKLRCKIKPCGKTSFISLRDSANHLKLHAEFKCNFCETTINYAPSLVTHEINEHTKKGEKVFECCARCNFTGGRSSMLTHYLKSHLDLPLVNYTCPICGALFPRKVPIRKAFLNHFNSQHDLTGVALSTVNKCNEINCRAYFRTYVQLSNHKAQIHGEGATQALQKKYVCADCRKRFKDRFALRRHKLNHTTGTQFTLTCKLPDCKKMFETDADMVYHERRHKLQWTTCPQCHKKVAKQNLETHLRIHKALRDGQIFSVYKCGKLNCKHQFSNPLDLKNHSQLHGEFNCQMCNTIVEFAPELPMHEIQCQKVGNEDFEVAKTYSCTRCTFSATRESILVTHFVELHLKLEMDRHTCLICKAQFYASGNYTKQVQYHFKTMHDLKNVGVDGKTYTCKVDGCSAYFLTPQQLARHKNSHITMRKFRLDYGGSKKYECGDCDKCFKTMGELRQHHRGLRHLDMKSKAFTCITDGCKLSFESQAELDDHLAASGVMKCPKCEKTFHGAVGLKAHEKFHKNQEVGKLNKSMIPKSEYPREYQCEECGKNFKWKAKLSQHRLVHSGPASWEYMCNICSKKCMTKDKLNEHMRTHSNEKPFICEICGVKYAHRHNLRIHVNNNHGDIVTDKPRNFDKTNLTSRKGVKVKPQKQEEAAGTSQSRRKRKRQPTIKVKVKEKIEKVGTKNRKRNTSGARIAC